MAYETQPKHFILTKIRNLLTMGSCSDMQTVPSSPFLLAQIKTIIHLKHSLNTFPPYLLQPLRWMHISLETPATETPERQCKTPKHDQHEQ